MSSVEGRFERLISDHAKVMSAAIRRVCGRRHRALVPDVEQEVRLALWKRLQSGKEIAHPISYVYKAALTTALAVVRRLEREVLVDMEQETSFQAATPSSAPGGLLPQERARLAREVLARLPGDQAQALRAYLAGFNHREVAELFGWSESVARHRIYRGIERLKASLKEESTA